MPNDNTVTLELEPLETRWVQIGLKICLGLLLKCAHAEDEHSNLSGAIQHAVGDVFAMIGPDPNHINAVGAALASAWLKCQDTVRPDKADETAALWDQLKKVELGDDHDLT